MTTTVGIVIVVPPVMDDSNVKEFRMDRAVATTAVEEKKPPVENDKMERQAGLTFVKQACVCVLEKDCKISGGKSSRVFSNA